MADEEHDRILHEAYETLERLKNTPQAPERNLDLEEEVLDRRWRQLRERYGCSDVVYKTHKPTETENSQTFYDWLEERLARERRNERNFARKVLGYVLADLLQRIEKLEKARTANAAQKTIDLPPLPLRRDLN
jgi:hypothetical protein